MKHLLLIIGLGIIIGLGGCSPEQAAQTQQAIADTRAEVATLRAQATTMPADSPERKLIETNATKLDDALAKAQAILTAAQTKDDAAIGAAATATGIPYAGLLVTLSLFGFREYQSYKRQQKAETVLRQVVASVDAAVPDKTEEQKLKMDAVQDSATKAAVAAVKTQ